MKVSDLVKVEGNLYPVFWEFPHTSGDGAAKSKAAYIVDYEGEARLVLKEQGYHSFVRERRCLCISIPFSLCTTHCPSAVRTAVNKTASQPDKEHNES